MIEQVDEKSIFYWIPIIIICYAIKVMIDIFK